MKARVKRMPVSPLALMQIMRQDTHLNVLEGLPRGVRLYGCTLDPYLNVINLFIEHTSFPLIDVYGQVVPVFDTELEIHTNE